MHTATLRTVTRPAALAVIDDVIDGQNRRIGKKIGGGLSSAVGRERSVPSDRQPAGVPDAPSGGR